jgi:integrase
MRKLVPAHPASPMFILPGREGFVPLTKHVFVSHFRTCLGSAGVPNAPSFRGHSFRRGAASWAFSCGVPGELIQLYGDWSSDAYKLYLEFSLEAKLQLANHIRHAINKHSS